MPGQEMLLRAAAPGSHKVIVHRAGRSRAQHRDDSPGPFLRDLSSHFHRQAIDNARNHPLDGLLLEKIAPQIQTCRAGCRNPQRHLLFFGRVFEAVKQAQLLHHSQSNRRKNSHVGNDSEKSAQAESRSLERRHFRRRANGARRNRVNNLRTQKKHVVP